ncbi:MAG: hypothetical protein ACYDA4_14500 [Ignavibacteriaceae bacterium]
MIEYGLNTIQQSIPETITSQSVDFSNRDIESSKIYYFAISSSNEVIKKYKFYGEEFDIYSDGENIIISHPLWSLSGMGESFLEAERNLIEESKEILEHYSKYSLSELTKDAVDMINFLQVIA